MPTLREGLGGATGGVPAGGVGRTETVNERVGRLLMLVLCFLECV
jgi:hypothetical protein